ncbi:MAG: hypothetical protein IJB90_00745 [Clostridia bacterium]|nr:hypothetical protein [Clostridia bacterium]
MNNSVFENKRLELLKRSNNLLEKTNKNYKIYQEERKLLFKLTTDNSINYEVWEKILDCMEILLER